MKEIVERLQEQRQVELAKSILESNGYKIIKKLRESDEGSDSLADKVNKLLEEGEYTLSEYIEDNYPDDGGEFDIVISKLGASPDNIILVADSEDTYENIFSDMEEDFERREDIELRAERGSYSHYAVLGNLYGRKAFIDDNYGCKLIFVVRE